MQGLSIVRAESGSYINHCFEDGLIKPLLKKQAHQEMEQELGVKEVSFPSFFFSISLCIRCL